MFPRLIADVFYLHLSCIYYLVLNGLSLSWPHEKLSKTSGSSPKCRIPMCRLKPLLLSKELQKYVGAGPSGLSLAYALVKLGYRNITVLEKHHTVGGMCESVDIEGKHSLITICRLSFPWHLSKVKLNSVSIVWHLYDLGGQVLAANSAPSIFHLAKEIQAEFEELDSHKFALIDSFTGKFQDMKVADDYVSMIPLTLKLQEGAKNSNRIGIHGVSEVASDPAPKYLESNGIKSAPKAVAYGYTASGYGFVQDMPYAYIHEFIRTSMAGKIRRFRGGYTSMWKRLGESLPVEVHCSTEVLAIMRNSDGVSVNVKNSGGEIKTLEFDKITLSGAFPIKNGRTYRSPSLNSEAEQIQSTAMHIKDSGMGRTVLVTSGVLRLRISKGMDGRLH